MTTKLTPDETAISDYKISGLEHDLNSLLERIKPLAEFYMANYGGQKQPENPQDKFYVGSKWEYEEVAGVRSYFSILTVSRINGQKVSFAGLDHEFDVFSNFVKSLKPYVEPKNHIEDNLEKVSNSTGLREVLGRFNEFNGAPLAKEMFEAIITEIEKLRGEK